MSTFTYLAAIGSRPPKTFPFFIAALAHIADNHQALVECGHAAIMRGETDGPFIVIAKFDLDGLPQ